MRRQIFSFGMATMADETNKTGGGANFWETGNQPFREGLQATQEFWKTGVANWGKVRILTFPQLVAAILLFYFDTLVLKTGSSFATCEANPAPASV